MWIKRAKEYEKNINSGDPVLIAEVVRDLHKKEGARTTIIFRGKFILLH